MRPVIALRLGRVSNLPTVWTNVLAALALAGVPAWGGQAPALALALSLFYVAGMYLNDAFDARRDARERPERPIPAGEAGRASVFALGFAGLGAGIAAVTAAAAYYGSAGAVPGSALSAAMLAGMIVLYDAWHAGNPVAPVLMGVNRMLVYATVALAAGGVLAAPVLAVGVLVLCYVVGLTYAARQEHANRIRALWPLALLAAPFAAAAVRLPGAGPAAWVAFAVALAWVAWALSLLRRRPPSVGRAVVALIAGIALLDGLWLALAGAAWGVVAGLAGFVLTLALQRWVPGT